jgi:hypothetical protein
VNNFYEKALPSTENFWVSVAKNFATLKAVAAPLTDDMEQQRHRGVE